MPSNSPKKPGVTPTPQSPEASAGRGESPPKRDVILATGITDDQKGVRVIRARDEQLELGEVRPLEHGKPLTGDVVRLRPRRESPMVCDVVTDVSREEIERAQSGGGVMTRRRTGGPPQVASQAYRDNWDAIYKRRSAPGSSELN